MPDPQAMPLPPPPNMGSQFMEHKSQSEDEAAYNQEMARLQQPQQPQQEAPAPKQPQQQAPQEQPQPQPVDKAREGAIQQESQRLTQPPFDPSRYQDPEAAVRTKAISNLGLPPDETKVPADQVIDQMRDQRRAEISPVIGAAASDIGRGLTVEMPRAIYTGVHTAVQATLDGAHSLGNWLSDITNTGAFYVDSKGFRAISHGEYQQLDSGPIEVPLKAADPSTVTGVLLKNVAQFGTGMLIGGTEMKALGLPTAAAGWAGRGVSAAKGFLAMFQSFDGAQGRLSDLVQSVPALRNPVTEALSSKSDDNEWVGRIKNAVEGTALAQVADGLVGGLRMLRAATAARDGAQQIVDADAARPPPAVSAGLKALGDEKAAPDSALTEIVTKAQAKEQKLAAAEKETAATPPATVAKMGEPAAPGETAGPASPGATEVQAKEPGVYINFARMDGPDDVKRAMSELATAFKGSIDEARRGVQTFERTTLGADSVNAWDTLMSRRVGEPLNDVQTVAARQLWATSTAKTLETANIAAEAPTPENLFAFRKMLATHAAIQEQVIAARTETARALSAWRIPVGPDQQRLGNMAQMLADTRGLQGGIETSLDLAQRVRALSNSGNLTDLTGFVEKSAYAKSRDAVLETWTNMLLTSPLTHVKVGISNAATVALRIAERGIASRLDQLLGNTDGVQVGEAAAQYAGLMGGLKDSMRFIGKSANALLSGEKPALGADPLSGSIKAATEGHYSQEGSTHAEYLQNQGAVSSQALGMANSGWLGNAIDLAGQIIRSPGRALTAEHDYFRSLGYRMELNAQAVRQAVADVRSGAITQDAVAARIQEIIANPPDNIKLAATNGMTYQTFTDAPGKLAEAIGGLRNEFPALRVILPFYKIPSRILSFTAERSPIAPLMSTFRANIAAGGPRQSLALAQMGLGTTVMMATADAVLSGHITGSGPAEPGQRAAMENEGWQPYSVKVGDKWVQYNRLETVGSSMALAADAVEAMRNFSTGVNADDPDVANLAMATTFSIANDITSKSYLQGLSNFFEAMGNPKEGGKKFLESFAGSAVPAGMATIDRQTDPYKRTVYDMISAVKARTPGESEDLPPVRNLWGEPVKNASGMGKAYDALVPASTKEPANEPIDKELLRLGVNINKPNARASFDGAQMDLAKDPKLYSRYQELAGNGYKDPAMGDLGLKDALNAIVTGNHPYSPMYQFLPDGSGVGEEKGTKGTMIRDIVNEYRRGAQQQLLSENPLLRASVQAKQDAMQQKTLQAFH
jgi:hypothetical protein